MYLHISVKDIISRLVLILAVSALIGFVVGSPLEVVCITLLAIVAWHYHQLLTLLNWIWQSKTLSPPDAPGVWGHIYDGLYRKIKKNRKKQKELNDKIKQFRDGAEALPDAAIVLSNELIILWSNKKAQNILSIRRKGDIGQRIDNLLRYPELIKYLKEGKFDTPCLISSPVNNEIKLELRFMSYGIDQILLLARDVSKVHQLEEMRRDFVANVSHELKTPLTVVRGYVEMIQASESTLEPPWQKAFSSIESQVTRMDRLVEQLLILSRIETNADQEELVRVDMPQLLMGLVEDAQWLNQEKQHQIVVNIDPKLSIVGIENELKSACSNLIANAIAYTPVHGTVEINWCLIGDRAKFSVKDNGQGIRPENVNRLTERFFRVDKSRSRDTGGSGLGLAIVKHVLNHHNAELVIESEWGEGSEFIIYFDPQSSRLLAG